MLKFTKRFQSVAKPAVEDSMHPKLSQKYQQVLRKNGINELFPIQKQTFDVISQGHDLIAKSKTGSGKTLAFLLPIAERLSQSPKSQFPRAMVLCPTRELASQVHQAAQKFLPDIRSCCIHGGVSYEPQIRALQSSDLVIGAPGRIVDLMENKHLHLKDIQILTLDESDYMLDQGFQPQLEQILSRIKSQKTTADHQTLLFSATVPSWVRRAASKFFRPGYQTVDLVGETNEAPSSIKYIAIPCMKQYQPAALVDLLQLHMAGALPYTKDATPGVNNQVLIFTNTIKEADDIATLLHQTSSNLSHKSIRAASLHSSLSQRQRDDTLLNFRTGRLNVLACTDVASRGLDIKDVRMVVQVGIPDVEPFVHRSGRTGRANATGTNVTFFSPTNQSGNPGRTSKPDLMLLEQIERQTKIKMEYVAAPSKKDVLEAVLSTTLVPQIKASMTDDLSLFHPYAQELMKSCGVESNPEHLNIVSALISKLTNHGSMQSRSTISGHPGKTAVFLQSKLPMGDLIRMLPQQAQLLSRATNAVGQNGIVCDVVDHNVSDFISSKKFEAEIITEDIPKLQLTGNAYGSRSDYGPRQSFGSRSGQGSRSFGRSSDRLSSDRSFGRSSDRQSGDRSFGRDRQQRSGFGDRQNGDRSAGRNFGARQTSYGGSRSQSYGSRSQSDSFKSGGNDRYQDRSRSYGANGSSDKFAGNPRKF